MIQTNTIQLQKLTLGYGNNTILENAVATIPLGKITFILGASGTGKSTLLKSIIGLLPPLSGNILINNKALYPHNTKEQYATMGVLFQEGALFENLTVEKNIALVLEQNTTYSTKEIKEKVARALEAVFLPNTQQLYPSELSGGMKKRVALARAIILEPMLLLCDEPTAGLDPILADDMDKLLLTMKSNMPNTTMIIISHTLESIKKLADYIILLNEKSIYFEGTASDFLHSTDSYIKKFLRS